MAVDHQTYVIKSGGRPQGAGSYGTPEDVQKLIARTKPGEIKNAAVAYDEIGNAIIKAQNALWDAAKVLADHWSGPAADSAQLALRRLYGTAGELVVRSNETAKTLQWYGGSILPMYRAIKWPEKNTDSPAAKAAADQVMKNLNERIAQTWDGMPPQIEKNLPNLHDRGDRPGGGTPSTSPGGGSGGSGGVGGAGIPRLSHKHPSLPPTGGHLPHGSPGGPGSPLNSPEAGGANLAGAAPSVPDSPGGGLGPGGNSLPGGGLGGPALGPGQSGPGMLGMNGPGGTFLPDNRMPQTSAGRLNGIDEPGLSGAGRGPGVRSTLGTGRGQGEGAPLASAGGRSEEKERERTTWLAEDRDLWTADSDAISGVIGDAPNLLRRSKQADDELLTVDELLSVDELQELLDLVDEPAKETGEDLSQPSGFDATDGSFFAEGPDHAHAAINLAQTASSVGEEDLIDFDGDLLGPDDDASGIQRA